MARDISLLQRVRIPQPCPVAWRSMEGDARIRLCRECGRHVYNLSAMTEAQAQQIIRDHEGDMCAQIVRRGDGSILTRPDLTGRSSLRRALSGLAAALVAAFAALAPGCGYHRTGGVAQLTHEQQAIADAMRRDLEGQKAMPPVDATNNEAAP